MKRLIVFRHAKSDWNAAYSGDHDRPLNKRGVRSAKTMGIVLAGADETPDHIISSTARRARTTAELAIEAGGWSSSLEFTEALYGTSVEGTLRVATTAASTIERLMLVGHQPTWGSVVESLTGARVAIKTATVVGIDLYVAGWSDAGRARGEIAYVLQPRMFPDIA